MGNIISLFVLNVINFFVFFIAVQYWTGEELSELYPKPIYQWIFLKMSAPGFYLSKLVSTIADAIGDALGNIFPPLKGAVKVGFFSGGLYGMTVLYNAVASVVVPVLGEFEYGGSKGERISNVLYITDVFRAVEAGDMEGRFFATFSCVFMFTLVSLVYYACVYGFLDYKVSEIPLFKPLGVLAEDIDARLESGSYRCGTGNPTQDSVLTIIVDNTKAAGLRLVSSFASFFGNIRVVSDSFQHGAPLVLVVAFAAMSVWQHFHGVQADWASSFGDFLDETGVNNILVTYLVTMIQMLIICLIGSSAYKYMPENARAAVDRTVNFCADSVRATREARAAASGRGTANGSNLRGMHLN